MMSISGLACLTVVKLAAGCTIVANIVVRSVAIHRMSNRPIARDRPMLCQIALVERQDWKRSQVVAGNPAGSRF